MPLVGRQYVESKDAICIDCRERFVFGVNVFTDAGRREINISGTCEKCFDSYFVNREDEEESEYSEDDTCPRCNDTWSGTSCGIPDCGWITGVEE